MGRTDKECREIVEAIDELCKEEMWSVEIHHDNPDFDGPTNVVSININRPKEYSRYCFTGDSLLKALQAAVRRKPTLDTDNSQPLF